MSRLCRPLAGVLIGSALAGSLVSTAAFALPRCEGTLLKVEIDERQDRTLALLRGKQFDALQRRMDGFLEAYAAGRITDEELFYEFGAFDRWGPFLTPLIEEWVARQPRSFAAHHAMALHLSSKAWQARGSALARETSEPQMRRFEDGLRAARAWSLRSIPLHPKPILAYQQLMANAKALRFDVALPAVSLKSALAAPEELATPRPDVAPIFRAGVQVQPDNVVVRYAYISLLAPRWGGSLEALNRIANSYDRSDLGAGRLASIRYAAMMEIASDHQFRNRLEDAVRAYRQAGAICKLNQPFVDIANIRLSQGRYEEALRAAEEALARVPQSTTGRLLKAKALGGLGRHTETVALLQQLLPEGMPEVAYLLGECYAAGLGGLPKDTVEARRLLSVAARQGDERAAKRLEALDAAR